MLDSTNSPINAAETLGHAGKLMLVFEALVLLAGCAIYPPASAPSSIQAYETSIRDSAVRNPTFAVPLRTISHDRPLATVATFTEWDIPEKLQRYTWVSLPEQLRELCRNKPDPVLAIQQILGLRPQPSPSRPDHHWHVITFDTQTSQIFRPCPGSIDISVPQCRATGLDPKLDPTLTEFLLNQMWDSHRTGFTNPSGQSDYGYPFTGMGISYNWDPASASHTGVSEFVVKAGATVSNARVVSPGQFCKGPSLPRIQFATSGGIANGRPD